MAAPRHLITSDTVATLRYCFAWSSKYRRTVFEPIIAERLKQLMAEVAQTHGMTLQSVEVLPDQVRVVVEASPALSPAEIVNRFKGGTSGILRAEFATLRSRLPTLWNRNFYVASVGAANDSEIERFIENQKGK